MREPPGYRRRVPPKRPKLDGFTDMIDLILEDDRTVHRKQHHTAKRIFERLRDEHGFTGKQTIVKDYVRERRRCLREMFVPLAHSPGHAQADFGAADAIIAGVEHRAHFFVMTLPHSDACFVAADPAATTEAFRRPRLNIGAGVAHPVCRTCETSNPRRSPGSGPAWGASLAWQ